MLISDMTIDYMAPATNIVGATFSSGSFVPTGDQEAYFTVSAFGCYFCILGKIVVNNSDQQMGFIVIQLSEGYGLLPAHSLMTIAVSDIAIIATRRTY